jgi:hypothetical protein
MIKMREDKSTSYGILVGKPEGKLALAGLGVDARKSLK